MTPAGVTRAIVLAEFSVTQTFPSLPATIPSGCDPAGNEYSTHDPPGTHTATLSTFGSVSHMLSSGPSATCSGLPVAVGIGSVCARGAPLKSGIVPAE